MDKWLFGPPVLVGERIVWLGSGSGLPQCGVVRWIGKLPEMGPDWTVGVELDNPLPYGGIDGHWGNRHLFTCEPKHGLLVPITKTIKESELFHLSKENIGMHELRLAEDMRTCPTEGDRILLRTGQNRRQDNKCTDTKPSKQTELLVTNLMNNKVFEQ